MITLMESVYNKRFIEERTVRLAGEPFIPHSPGWKKKDLYVRGQANHHPKEGEEGNGFTK